MAIRNPYLSPTVGAAPMGVQQPAQYQVQFGQGVSATGKPNPYPVGYIGPGGEQMNPGYTSGPAGSSGGLTGGMSSQTGWQGQTPSAANNWNGAGPPTGSNSWSGGYGPGIVREGPNAGQYMNPDLDPNRQRTSMGGYGDGYLQQNMAPTQYGYGTAPGQTSRGYYEQETPVGSFAAADRTRMPAQQYANTYTAGNDYLGRTTQGIGGQSSVMPYAQQIAGAGQTQNPWLGQQTSQVGSAGTNQYMGKNPYLDQQIADAQRQAGESFKSTVLPQFDRMDQASGSFGNTGVQAARERAMQNFGQSQANAANQAYLQDYQQTQGLQEAALNRNQQVNMANAGFNAGDLSRNLGGSFQQTQQGMQGLGSLLNAGQFDASLGQAGNIFNAGLADTGLGRNQQLAQGMSQFNAGAGNTNSMFNAGQGNQLGQYGAGLNQQTNLYNAGAGNSMLENSRNRTQNQGQFDATLDRGIWNDNMGWMRQGQQDQWGMAKDLYGLNQQGITNANNIQDKPLDYWKQFLAGGSTIAGQGGSTSQQMQADKFLAAMGGGLTFAQAYKMIYGD